MDYERTIDDVVELLKPAGKRPRRCTLLIGAGCSVDAGVPLAREFVGEIRKRYPQAYKRAGKKTESEDPGYPACMAELPPAQRRDLIAEYVDRARINWTHVCIARLLQAGYVDRVLTTNFDFLVVKACALLGEFPAIYDFAASQLFKPADIPERAVFYLHGQRTGFVLMNVQEEMKAHSKRLAPVFQDAGSGRVWIVVGYSGLSDPVFDQLARIKVFDNGLYWVGFQDGEPPRHVAEKLLVRKKNAFFVPGYDANSFFVTLAQRLGIFPPPLVTRPFSHLKALLDTLTPFQLPGQGPEADVTRTARRWIDEAIESCEMATERAAATTSKGLALAAGAAAPAENPALAATSALMQGHYDQVLAFREQYDRTGLAELGDALASAYMALGTADLEAARQESATKAKELYASAAERFEASVRIKPDLHQALAGWGMALAERASQESGEQARRLDALADEKLAAAVAVEPPDAETLTRWGGALAERAKGRPADEAREILELAAEKLRASLALQPESYRCLNALGTVLGDAANLDEGLDAERLYAAAAAAHEKAHRVRPEAPEPLHNQALTLMDQARRKSGREAERLFDLARQKLLEVDALAPGASAYDLACVSALTGQLDACRDWLRKSADAGALPPLAHVEADADLDPVRGEAWFAAFLERLR